MKIVTVTMFLFAFATALFGIEPEQRQLLKQFRDEFIEITPGKGKFPKSFIMGGESNDSKPRHRVTFGYEFSIAKYEVPQNLWTLVMGSNPSRWKGPWNSAEMLSFDEARQFCQSATRMLQNAKLIAADQVIRLPSEAEWEFVARAGTKTRYSFGDDAQQLDDFAWSTHNAAGNDPPVGAKKPNPWGLYDIHGYLWEWCADIGHQGYDLAPADGSVWKTSGDAKKRVLRGGSWKDAAPKLTSSYRWIADASTRDTDVGLRCVLANKK